jgi:hypothetical protein
MTARKHHIQEWCSLEATLSETQICHIGIVGRMITLGAPWAKLVDGVFDPNLGRTLRTFGNVSYNCGGM